MAEARWPAQLVDQHAPEGVEAHMRCTMSRLSATENVAHDRGTHTGAIAILDLTANRARREYTGGLYSDALVTLDRLDRDLVRVRADLNLAVAEGCA